jgi:hypothetical protein
MTERNDLVFRALANPSRRLLLDKLFEDDGQTLGAQDDATGRHAAPWQLWRRPA